MNFWCGTERAACGSVLQTVVFAVKTLHEEVHLAHKFMPKKFIFGTVVIKIMFNHLGCGVSGVLINDRRA